jgi:predicted RNase H-like nuclease
MIVAGVDGCRTGWAVAFLDLESRGIDVHVLPAIAPLIARVERGELAALAVDMPIGLPAGERRMCDHEVRAELGARRSSVFPTPARVVLGALDHVEACARSEALCGKRLSVQAWNLVPRIAELDSAMTPDLQARVVEAHPELAFSRLHGAPMAHPKRTPPGEAERRAVLVGAGIDVPAGRVRGSAVDDILDAAALALVAEAVAAGDAARMGDGARDARGLRMEIVTIHRPGGPPV